MIKKEYALSEIADMQYGKMLKKDRFTDEGYPVFSGYRITGYTDQFHYKDPTVIVVARGVGGTGDVKMTPPKSWLTNLSIAFLTDKSIVDDYYLCNLLNNENLREKLDSGASISQITIGSLENYKIKLPCLLEQRKISQILKSYDDLIENNSLRIQILETIAQKLYQEWFIHYRFPGHEQAQWQNTDQGKIPLGWEVKLVADVIQRKKAGTRYTQKNVKESGGVVVIDQSRAEALGYHDNAADHLATPTNPIAIFGDHTCKMQLMIKPFSVGPNVVPFVPKNNYPAAYIFYLVHSLVETQEYKRHWTELNAKEVVIATSELAEKFSNLVSPMLQKINILQKANVVLRESRDMLLSKLIQ